MTKRNRRKLFLMFSIFFIIIFCFGFFISENVKTDLATPIGITIVIDAGHGGVDGGSVGTKTGITESELNLIYAQKLTKYLSNFGFNIVNTRSNMNGLYKELTNDFKLVDMKKRIDIINESNAQILVSIHMNKFENSNENGAQVFFKQKDEKSKKLSESIRDILVANFENARELTLKGDYYILNNTNIIGVIVECGFLSNPTEEINLQNESYQDKLCYSIYAGIINFLDIVNY